MKQPQVQQTIRNLSIGSRLGISFGAVAILAIAANMTVEHGASVIQTTKIFGPSPIARETPRVAPAVPTPVPAAVPEPPVPVPLESAELLDALAQFDHSLLLRAQAATSENKVLVAATEQHLALETASFIAKASAGSAGVVRSLAAQVRTLRATGDALISASDARRAAFRPRNPPALSRSVWFAPGAANSPAPAASPRSDARRVSWRPRMSGSFGDGLAKLRQEGGDDFVRVIDIGTLRVSARG